MKPEYHINPSGLSDEQLLAYQLAIQERLAELAVKNADCEDEWRRRFPPQQ